MDAEGAGGEVCEEGCEEAGKDGLIVERAVGGGGDGEDFEAEDGAGDGSTEDGAEASGYTGHEEDAAVGCGEGEAGLAEEPGELVGEGGSGLEGGAFAAGGASEEVGEDSADKDEGRHAGRDDAVGDFHFGVDLFEDEVVSGFDGAAIVVVHEADCQTCEREEGDDPKVGFADTGGPFERDEEQGGGHAREDSRSGREDEPAGEVRDDVGGCLWRVDGGHRSPTGIVGVISACEQERLEAEPHRLTDVLQG